MDSKGCGNIHRTKEKARHVENLHLGRWGWRVLTQILETCIKPLEKYGKIKLYTPMALWFIMLGYMVCWYGWYQVASIVTSSKVSPHQFAVVKAPQRPRTESASRLWSWFRSKVLFFFEMQNTGWWFQSNWTISNSQSSQKGWRMNENNKCLKHLKTTNQNMIRNIQQFLWLCCWFILAFLLVPAKFNQIS